MGQRALGRPEHSRRAIATAFARRPSRSASPVWWRWLGLAGASNVHNSGRLGLASYCSSFGQSGFYCDAGVWTLGAQQQRVNYSRPLSNSFPSLSFWTSHLRPSRPSWEGFGAGLQQRRWGEARSRVVHSDRGGIQILPEVWKGRLIKPWKFTALQAKWKCRISIGRWNGRLCQMRGVDALVLVHWGTLHLGGVTGLWLMLGHSLGCWIAIGPVLIRGHWGGWAGRWIFIGWAAIPSPWLSGMRQSERSSSWGANGNGGRLGITSKHRGSTRFRMGITRFHMGITRFYTSITRLHRGITIIHISAARRRRRRIVDPVHAAFVKGLGDSH